MAKPTRTGDGDGGEVVLYVPLEPVVDTRANPRLERRCAPRNPDRDQGRAQRSLPVASGRKHKRCCGA